MNTAVKHVESPLIHIAMVFITTAALNTITCASPGEQAKQIIKDTGVQGGLVVHVNCGDGELTAALCANDRYVVHGIDADAKKIQQARKHIRSLDLYGPVSAETFDGRHLPYADNLVNLLVAEDLGEVPAAEVMRVLCANGVAYIKQEGAWKKTVKPRPANVDEWTHYLHDTTNNAVANDTVVGPPQRVQWIGAPKWARSHEHLATLSALVSTGGRVFYIVDEGPTASIDLPSDWKLVARDAFNGVILWKRSLGTWEDRHRPFRSGPAQLPRRLVAVGDRVYVTLGYGQPLTALDAATGDVIRTYKGTADTREIMCDGEVLYLTVGGLSPEWPDDAERRGETTSTNRSTVMAVRADDGRVLWQKKNDDTNGLLPLTLAVADGRVLFQNTQQLICSDKTTGKVHWRADRPTAASRVASNGPTLVVYGDVVISADLVAGKTPLAKKDAVNWQVSMGGGGKPAEAMAFSVKTGEHLWTSATAEGYKASPDLLIIDGKLWTGNTINARAKGITQALDVRTGKVVQERPGDSAFFTPGMPHHRCYRNKATSRFLLLGRAGVEFIDTTTGDAIAHHWIRGTCQYGIMPANGLLYTPPHTCACFIRAKLNSFNALSAAAVPDLAKTKPVLEKGDVYDIVKATASDLGNQDWPTYRHDPARSGSTPAIVPAKMKPAWRTDVGGKLSSVVVAEGRLYVASIDQHTVHALAASTGETIWQYTAGARVDSPPTIWNGRVLFGSADGWVYCLSASDGALAWRFRAAPQERRVMVYGQLESAWPVHGSVLVKNGQVCFVAGRSGYLDGGVILYRLDPVTGKMLSRTFHSDRDPQTGHQAKGIVQKFEMPGLLPDVLSVDGDLVYMRHTGFDADGRRLQNPPPHLFNPIGFLDDTWWHRSYTMYGKNFNAGWSGWSKAGNRYPAGRILSFNDKTIYGFGRSAMPGGNAGQWNKGEHYQLFAADKASAVASSPAPPPARRRGQKKPRPVPKELLWSTKADLAVRAMILTPDRLFVAGPLGPTHKSLEAHQGKQGVVLRAIGVSDAETQSECQLDALPVWDGMAATNGRLYLATTDGRVLCFGEK